MKSSIVDIPRQYNEKDLFGIKIYQEALIDYIKLTDTPMTIALQGEWGSGKTSLMNLLKWNLCDVENSPYYSVWINTWQYSLMKTPSQAIISILEGIINQIGAINPNEHKWAESKKKIGNIFKKMASVGTKAAVSTIGIDGEAVDELFETEDEATDICQLKEEINKLIGEALANHPDKMGVTFYIDDLDRIDPPMAVEILELLKNIFDLPHCIFILAIDYDVVIKGLKPKFGELTEKNEREFRSFFDKIIQLPFSMPVASYNIDTFLVEALKKIEFFTEEELGNTTLAENLSEIARLSVGSNPRSLKRLTNTLSLISIINRKMQTEEALAEQHKIINFALVCMQIAYPYVYDQLTEEPNFKGWNEKIASKLKLRSLTKEEQESLDCTEEFDEEWEKVTFRMCQKETFLSNRAFQISGLLNKIAKLIDNDEMLGEIISATIELSAVTNLRAFDAPKKLMIINREWWVEKSSENHMIIIDEILKLINSFNISNKYELKYNKGYIGLQCDGIPRNWIYFIPQRRDIVAFVKVNSSEEFNTILTKYFSNKFAPKKEKDGYKINIPAHDTKIEDVLTSVKALEPILLEAEKEKTKK